MKTFEQLGVAAPLIHLMKQQGITDPTPIQEASLPYIFQGQDVIGRAQTGTGKTLCYLLPAVQSVRPGTSQEQILIITPTRELARQIFDVLRPFAEAFRLDAADLIGGRTVENQLQKLKRSPHIIIGTPGRLLDHMRRRSLDLSGIRMVVLDEADQMMDAGFREEIDALIDEAPKKRQLLLFSATMPEDVKKLARKYMKSPRTVSLPEKAAADTVEQRIYETTDCRKFPLLIRHIREMNPYLAIVFCNTREKTAELADRLSAELDMPVGEIHGDMSQGQRNQVIRDFEKAKLQILVASDVAARGLDVPGVTHVFNYEIPRNLEYYIHRIGRTGRGGAAGLSVTYTVPEDAELLRKLEKSINETLTRYDESGKVKRVRKAVRPRKVTPGMYKPTKEKEHKALGHSGGNMRRRVRQDDGEVIVKRRHNARRRPKKTLRKKK